MRETFFLIVGAMAVVGGAGLFAWLVIRALYTMYADHRLDKQLTNLHEETQDLRIQREKENQARLDNGCDHNFGGGHGEFAANVCIKCGLERERPKGNCDHTWKRVDGNVLFSRCELCDKEYRPSR